MNKILPTIPIPAQVADDWPDVDTLHQDFPATNELHILDGKPEVPTTRRRGLRRRDELGLWGASIVTSLYIGFQLRPWGELLLQIAGGGR